MLMFLLITVAVGTDGKTIVDYTVCRYFAYVHCPEKRDQNVL